jgi:hypothetical protein
MSKRKQISIKIKSKKIDVPNIYNVELEKSNFIKHMREKLSRCIETSVFYDKYIEINENYTSKHIQNLNKLRLNLWKPTDINNVELTLIELRSLNPYIEVVTKPKIWKDYRRMISTGAYSKGVGRSIKLFVKDRTSGKILGVAELSSDFGSLGVRDEHIGWSHKNRFKDKKLRNTAVCSTVVPSQPLGFAFLGGKLITLLLTSDVVRKLWKEKYNDTLYALCTTSLYGHKESGSQYSGLGKYWKSLGHSKGKIILNPDNKIYTMWTKWLKENHEDEYKKAMKMSGPKQKVLELLLNKLGLRKDAYMHNFQRGVYFSAFYKETKEFLKNEVNDVRTKRFDDSIESLIEVWRKKAETRYLKLVEENRLSANDLFYSDLIGLSLEESMIKYGYKIEKNLNSSAKNIVNGFISDKVFNVFLSNFYTSNAKPNLVEVKTKVKSIVSIYFSGINSHLIETLYFSSFFRTFRGLSASITVVKV